MSSHQQGAGGLRLALSGVLGLCALSSSVLAQGQLATRGEVLLTHGEAHPSLPAGASIGGTSSFDSAVMDSSGNILFRARMTGGSVTAIDERAYFYGRTNADLHIVVRGGDPAPTLTGVTLNTATASGIGGSPRISPSGIMMWSSSLSGTNVTTINDTAIFWGMPNGFIILAREGDLAGGSAGVAGCTYSTSFSISAQPTGINAAGVCLFQSSLSGGDVNGTTNNSAWFSGVPGAVDVVQRKGDTVLSGQVVSALGFVSQLNAGGQVLHDETLSTTLGNPPATALNDKVLFLWTPGLGNQVVAREGDPAPGTQGAIFGNATNTWSVNTGSTTLTDSGNTAIVADLIGGDATSGVNDRAIYFGGANGLSMVVRRGDAAPGTLGLTFDVFNNTSLTCQDGGRVAFFGALAGSGVTTSNDSSMWVGTAGNLQMLAREGDPAPGVAGAIFGASGITGAPLMNTRGQIVFNATLLVNGGNVSALYSWDEHVGLTLEWAAGDTFNSAVGPVVPSTFGGNQFNAGDSRPLSFNNKGDFVYRAGITGGSFIVRGHVGRNQCGPSAISATLGGLHAMNIDAGIANANGLYVVLCTGAGTAPGFNYGVHIPINFDIWTNLGLAALNVAPWGNTFGFLDGNGRTTATFNMPPGFPQFAGVSLDHALVVLGPSGFATAATEPCGFLLF
ncbi:MAG: choice-of-anchor tandem repeat NxxGxxAF-containing protein [Planctomycetota bacterium]